jgi:hypothetical protein
MRTTALPGSSPPATRVERLGCFVLAFGHTTIGLRWVLPNLTKGWVLPNLNQGTSAKHAAWSARDDARHGALHLALVSILLVGFGILLTALAWAPGAPGLRGADPTTLRLSWFAAFWLAATALACPNARRRPRNLRRFPVPLVFVVIAVLCSTAST